MDYRILKLLGLQGLVLIDLVEHYPSVFLYVTPRRKTADCSKCDKRCKSLHDYRPPRLIKHYKLGKKQVYLVLFARRFFCCRCRKPFTEKVYGIAKWTRKTAGLEEEIIERLRESSFLGIKRRLGVNYHSQVKLLKKVMKPFQGDWTQEEVYPDKISLGIDEHSFSGHDMLLTITNLTLPRLISILPDDRQMTLIRFINNIPQKVKKKIKEVCIDLNASYANVIKKLLPQARLVIDHFHVIQDANKRITEERRILQNVFKVKVPHKLFLKNREHLNLEEKEKMQEVFRKLPDLKHYWETKEKLREIYALKGKNRKQEARERLKALIIALRHGQDLGLTQWAKTLYHWQEEILNYFDYQTTNAYTEGLITKLKLIKRISFGFRNKEVYIRKAALACLPLTFLPHFFT